MKTNSTSPCSKPYHRYPTSSSHLDDERAMILDEYRYDNGGYRGSRNLMSGPRQAAYSDYPSVYYSSTPTGGVPESYHHHDGRYYHQDRGAGEECQNHQKGEYAGNGVDGAYRVFHGVTPRLPQRPILHMAGTAG